MKYKFFEMVLIILITSIVSSCSLRDSENGVKKEYIDEAGEFQDYKDIFGKVKGHWKKENNPYIITDAYINSGDTLVVDSGVQVRGNFFSVARGAVLILNGSPNDPIIWSGYYSSNANKRSNGTIAIKGKFLAKNSILSGSIQATVVNQTTEISILNCTWINASIWFWLDQYQESEPNYYRTNSKDSVVPVNLFIKKSVISARRTFNASEENESWILSFYGEVDPRYIVVDSNCLNDFTYESVIHFNTIWNKAKTVATVLSGNNIENEAEFLNYPKKEQEPNDEEYYKYIYDVTNNVNGIDLRIKNDNVCKKYGANSYMP